MPLNIPTVIEKSKDGERAYDLYSRLLKDRIIMLDTLVVTVSASIIVASLLFLESQDSKKPIHFYINSPGGSVTDGLGIYDTMKTITCPVYTYVLGNACSMGSLLASSGDKRYISKFSKHMMHQVSYGAQGNVQDVRITVAEAEETNDILMDIYVENTGQSRETILEDLNRDKWKRAQACIDYGLADEIIPYAQKEIED